MTNGAIVLRGHPEHYDEWGALVDGYGWESWLPWSRAIESDRDFPDAPWHGDAGPIPISRYPRPQWLELQERFCEAALAVGHEWVDDLNAPGALGIGPIPLNMVDGVRQTPADHYLDPALGRGNLALRAGVLARVPSANTHLATIALAEHLAAGFPGAGEPAAATPPSAEATWFWCVKTRCGGGARPSAYTPSTTT